MLVPRGCCLAYHTWQYARGMDDNDWMQKNNKSVVDIFDVRQSWKMSEPEKVLALIKALGIWRLGNLDGCCCSNFIIRGVGIDIACGKGRNRGVFVFNHSMDYEDYKDPELLRPIAEEVKHQLEECDGRGPAPICLREWSHELDDQ